MTSLIGRRVRAVKFYVKPEADARQRDEHGLIRDDAGDVMTIDDNVTVPPGTEGTIRWTDDAGSISVKWDNGRSISLLPGRDEWELAEGQILCTLCRELGLGHDHDHIIPQENA